MLELTSTGANAPMQRLAPGHRAVELLPGPFEDVSMVQAVGEKPLALFVYSFRIDSGDVHRKIPDGKAHPPNHKMHEVVRFRRI